MALAAGSVLASREPVRVRLLQIDTPEQGEPLSDEATAALTALAGRGTTVWALGDREPRPLRQRAALPVDRRRQLRQRGDQDGIGCESD